LGSSALRFQRWHPNCRQHPEAWVYASKRASPEWAQQKTFSCPCATPFIEYLLKLYINHVLFNNHPLTYSLLRNAMTPLFRKDRNARLRAIRAYLLIVLFCTLLLFASSVVTLHEQQTLPFETLGLNPAHADFEIWFTAISAILFLSVLAIGLFLLIRVTWDIRWLELRSNFITGVSHEFKTPLSLIRLYSETLADEEANFSPEDRKKYTGIILRESERLSRLINNVLEFTKMEQSSKPGVLPEGDLTPTIAQAIDDYSEYLKWKGFHLSTFIQPDLPPVRFNSEQVSQMILNLLHKCRRLPIRCSSSIRFIRSRSDWGNSPGL